MFDVADAKIGEESRSGVPIHDLKDLKRVSRREHIDIAVIAVPAESAQQVLDQVTAVGIKAVLNFSPGALKVPAGVKLKSVDLTVSLESLSFFLAQGIDDEKRWEGAIRCQGCQECQRCQGGNDLTHVDAPGPRHDGRRRSKARHRARSRRPWNRPDVGHRPPADPCRRVKKGDPLQAARLAGIMAAKRTSELIPLCHPLSLTHVAVDLTPTRTGYTIESRVRTADRTGVEMEALTAVSVAALTLYDMVKAVDKEMTIGEICLMEKTGGRSGTYRRKKNEERRTKA